MMANLLISMLIFIMGLVFGSFFIRCIYRIPKGESILQGETVYPKNRKSFLKHMGIQSLTGLVFTSLFMRYGFTPEFFASVFLMSILIIVFFIDLEHKIIPHGLTLTGLGGGLLLVIIRFFYPQRIFENPSWVSHVLGILPGSGVLFLVAMVGLLIYKSDEGMGMGDVYIFAPVGLILGWRLCLLNLFISIFIAGFFSFFILLLRKKKRKDTIPFGPFIVIGTYLVLMGGTLFLDWYFYI